jgi:uncharacterized protein
VTGDHVRVLLVTGGHPFELRPFLDVFESNPEIDVTHVVQPEAQRYFDPARCEPWDVIVLYDMPGLRFTHADPPVVLSPPPADYIAGFKALLDAGKGMVFLHHAIAGWPSWPAYAEILGGRFHYQPSELRGVAYPDSGYRFDVTHRVEVIEPAHPICTGLGQRFELTDELYLIPVFEDEVVPLMRTTYAVSDSNNFYSADQAIRGRRNSNAGWSHTAGSNLVCWVKNSGRSPVAYVQFGDGPTTYGDANYRRIVANAIHWAASDNAHAWAQRTNEST